MKKLLVLSFLISTTFFAQAMMDNSFIGLTGGAEAEADSLGKMEARVQLSFGHSIMDSMDTNYGFFEVGVGSTDFFNDLDDIVSLKYGYEFMINDQFSLGLDVGGFAASDFESDISLEFHGMASVFALFNVDDSIGILARLGASLPFEESPSVSVLGELGIRRYL